MVARKFSKSSVVEGIGYLKRAHNSMALVSLWFHCLPTEERRVEGQDCPSTIISAQYIKRAFVPLGLVAPEDIHGFALYLEEIILKEDHFYDEEVEAMIQDDDRGRSGGLSR